MQLALYMTSGTQPFSPKPLLIPVHPTWEQGNCPSVVFSRGCSQVAAPRMPQPPRTDDVWEMGYSPRNTDLSAHISPGSSESVHQSKDKEDGGQGEEVAQGIYFSGA